MFTNAVAGSRRLITVVSEHVHCMNNIEPHEFWSYASTSDHGMRVCRVLAGSAACKKDNSWSTMLVSVIIFGLEAAATAYILLALIVPKLMGASSNSMPQVLQQSRDLPPTAKSALVICSDGCFRSCEMAQWLLQVSQIDSCAILPIIAEDGFRFPTQSFYGDLSSYSQLEKVDLRTYVRVIKTVFQEIAVVFSPRSPTALK